MSICATHPGQCARDLMGMFDAARSEASSPIRGDLEHDPYACASPLSCRFGAAYDAAPDAVAPPVPSDRQPSPTSPLTTAAEDEGGVEEILTQGARQHVVSNAVSLATAGGDGPIPTSSPDNVVCHRCKTEQPRNAVQKLSGQEHKYKCNKCNSLSAPPYTICRFSADLLGSRIPAGSHFGC